MASERLARPGGALCALSPSAVVVADQDGGIWRLGDGGGGWRRVAPGFAHVEQLSAWYPDLSCQGSNAVELAQAFCEAACGGEVDSHVRQTTDGGHGWRTVIGQTTSAGGVRTDPASGPRVLIEHAVALGRRGLCLVGSTYNGPQTVAISCAAHPHAAFHDATLPRLPFPPRTLTGVALQGVDFLNATTGWMLVDQYTTRGTPASTRAKTEIWSTDDGGVTWHAPYVSGAYRLHWCSKLHTSWCWR